MWGPGFSYTDNQSSLTKQELSGTTQYGPVNGQRSGTKKYDVYSGVYKRDLKALRIYSDFYQFLFSNNVAAPHASPEFKAQRREKPLWNLGLGFLVSFKDGKDENTIVNAELYYNFLDIFKTSESDYRLFERNSIGIRFTFPVTFKN